MDGVGKGLDPDFDFISNGAPYIVEIKGAKKYLKDQGKLHYQPYVCILHHYQKLNYESSIPTLATKFLNTIFRPKLSKAKDFDDIQSMITDFQMRQVPEYIQSLDDLIPR